MRSKTSLALALILGGCAADVETPREAAAPPAAARPAPPAALPPELAGSEGPSGTSRAADSADRYDAVGYASWYGEELEGNATASGTRFDPDAITAAHRTLPLGSYAEVTALDSGRTIVVLVNDRGPGRTDRVIDLSRGAAQQLGVDRNPQAAVRVRSVIATPADIAALRSGKPASPRLDAPPALLVGLRKGLPGGPRAALDLPSPPDPPPRPKPNPAATAGTGRYVVQIAAFSSEARARALAESLDGSVTPAGAVWRVRLGPFADGAAAQRARDGAVRRGYGDAKVLTEP